MLRQVSPEQEGFFNLLSHIQDAQMDEQRCSINIIHHEGICDAKYKDKSDPEIQPPVPSPTANEEKGKAEEEKGTDTGGGEAASRTGTTSCNRQGSALAPWDDSPEDK
uniref:Purkinje cell protein 2 homolog isoform X2 n=1 Tax=Geotrypetes seraphini TaxID=260995 RepID=A0A6P8N8J5_GEOSA|nr:Purkinje cell protein 2 homolog isoform X2 [Geotrypetes seraphini]